MPRIFVLLLLVTFQCVSQTKPNLPLVPLDILGALPQYRMVRISPSGESISYELNDGDNKALIVFDIKQKKMRGGINVSNLNIKNMYFIDDDRVIIIASQFRAIFGYKGRHNVSTAFLYDSKNNELRQLLTPGKGIYRGQTSLGSIVGLSPDKKYAYMPAFIGDDNARYASPKFMLTRVTLEKERTPKVLRSGGTHDAIDFFVDENGEFLARERYDNESNIHIVQSYIDGQWVEIFKEEAPYRYRSFVGLTPDKSALVMLSYNKKGRAGYYLMSLTDGSISDELFVKEGVDIERVLTDIQRVVYGVKYSGFKPSYAFFDKKLEKTYQMIQQAMPNNVFYIADHTPDWKKIVFHMEGENSSGDYFLFQNGQFEYLVSNYPDIAPEAVAKIEEYEVTAQDGFKNSDIINLSCR